MADAIAEAVAYNRRSWRYVYRILQNWATTGRGDAAVEGGRRETHRRSDRRDLDPGPYQYGHYLDRRRRCYLFDLQLCRCRSHGRCDWASELGQDVSLPVHC